MDVREKLIEILRKPIFPLYKSEEKAIEAWNRRAGEEDKHE